MKIKTLNTTITPVIFLLLLTFSSIISAAPPEWANLGQSVEVTGELEIIFRDDFENHHGEKHYYIHDKSQGKRFELEFQGKPPKNATTGSFVRVRGQVEADAAENELILFMAADDGSTTDLETLASASIVSEEHKTIVLVANFNNAAVSCPVSDIEDTMFTDPDFRSVNDLYRETSLNKIQLTGMVAGPFTINYSSTDTCDVYAWAEAADMQAEANGIDLTQYDHKVYVLPEQNSCGWYGSATVGGEPSKAWITQCYMSDVYAHELGHNLGMGHSGTPTGTYSDTSDIMGFSGGDYLRQINGPHQEQMGWRDAQQIIEINSDGVYDIAPLELDTASSIAPQLLKIRKPDTAEWYYLSYRQPIGFDNSLSSSYLSGLSIHLHEGNGSTEKTVWIDTLADGEEFSDLDIGLTIIQTYHSENSVSIEITLPDTCVNNSPTVNITPLSQTDIAGSTLSYDLNITNNDTAYCSDSTWALSSDIPSDWSEGLVSSITIAPGESTTINWQVASSNTAPDSDYALSIDMTDIETVTHYNSGVVNYTVATPIDLQVPTAPTLMTALEQRKDILLNWQASEDNNAVAGYRIYRNDIEIATTASTSYIDRKASGVDYSYYTIAFDVDNNLSEPSNIATAATTTTDTATSTDEKTNQGKNP